MLAGMPEAVNAPNQDWMDATELAARVRRREVAPIELVDAAISRLEQLNPTLNAVVTPLFERAREAARSSDLPDGPFRGVPLLLKDFFCETAGDPYFEGCAGLKNADHRSAEDTVLAARFRRAGFIVVGKTNTPEFASGPLTEPRAFGPTRNPWSLEHSTGGSSGGSAAAVAAGLVAVAHGNDGTGSLRIPASCCGLVGLKPSRGRTSPAPNTAGILGNVVEHVLTRSVRDSAAVLDAVAGSTPGDLFVAPPPARPFVDEVGLPPGRLRVGLLCHDESIAGLREVEPSIPTVDPECVAAVRRAGALLESLGHDVAEAWPSALGGASGLGPAARILSTSWLASRMDHWGERLGRPLTESDMEPASWAAAEEGRRFTAVEVHAAVARLRAGACRVAEWWDEGWDLLVTPTMAQPPPRIGEIDALSARAVAIAGAFGFFTMPFSYSGQPAISLPLHWTGDGLPIGVQLVAAYAREDVLLRVAGQLEQAVAWAKRQPPPASRSREAESLGPA
jgi:amidase